VVVDEIARVPRDWAYLQDPPLQILCQPRFHFTMVIQGIAGAVKAIVEGIGYVYTSREQLVCFILAGTIPADICRAFECVDRAYTVLVQEPLVWVISGFAQEEEYSKVPRNEVLPDTQEDKPFTTELPLIYFICIVRLYWVKCGYGRITYQRYC